MRFLFVAEFMDGTSYYQNDDDVSIYDDKTKSCFFDVLKEIENGKKLVNFYLSNATSLFLVCLVDGSFQVGDSRFLMHSDESLKDFRLVFYREHTHQFNQINNSELSHTITYCIGWQANDQNGKNVQRIMRIE